METPTTANSRSLYVFWNSMNQGISILQGPHHVAQKFTRTTFPLRSESLSVAPVASLREKSGAGLRSFASLTETFADSKLKAEQAIRPAASAVSPMDLNGRVRRSIFQLYRQRAMLEILAKPS